MPQKNWCIHDSKRKEVSLFPTIKNFTAEKPTTVLAFLADLKDTFDNCCVYESKPVWVLAYLLSDGIKVIYESYTANWINRMQTDAHVYHGTWPVLINARIHRLLNKNVLQEAHYIMTWGSQKPNETNKNFGPDFLGFLESVVKCFGYGKSWLLRSRPEAFYSRRDAGRFTIHAF